MQKSSACLPAVLVSRTIDGSPKRFFRSSLVVTPIEMPSAACRLSPEAPEVFTVLAQPTIDAIVPKPMKILRIDT
jgi:hypothetical protein